MSTSPNATCAPAVEPLNAIDLNDYAQHILKLGDESEQQQNQQQRKCSMLPRMTEFLQDSLHPQDAKLAMEKMSTYLQTRVRNYTPTPSPLSKSSSCHPSIPHNALTSLYRAQQQQYQQYQQYQHQARFPRSDRYSKERMDECALTLSLLLASGRGPSH